MAQMKNRPKWPNGPYGQMAEKTHFCQMVRLVKWKNVSNFSKMDNSLMATYANWPNESYCQMTLWHQNSQVAK